MTSNENKEMSIHYTDAPSLALAYQDFYTMDSFSNLIIHTENDFAVACEAFNSMFTRIEAAGGIIRNENDEYLVIKRLGFWDLPKGKLNHDEPKESGAMREVTEETGLTGLVVTKHLPSSFHIYTDRKGREILKETFWFEMMCPTNQILIPQTEEDITEVNWIKADELRHVISGSYASLQALWKEYLKL